MAMGGPGGSQCDTIAAAVAAVRVADAPHRRASALPGASGSLRGVQVLADSVAVAGPAGPGISNVDCSRHRPRPSGGPGHQAAAGQCHCQAGAGGTRAAARQPATGTE
jgi:hypothetical protein